MTMEEARACLNCGAPLTGRFCAACGQRDVPAYPTVREMAGEAWEEFSGWDGRLARTLATLVRRPGQLTVDAIEGRRARYIKPLRLYLVVSVMYFLLAAAAPNLRPREVVMPGGMVKIDLMAEGEMAPEQRARVDATLARAPWWAQLVLEPMLVNPARFRQRMTERLPRVFFALVPIFALLVGLFYRRRPYMQHLTFALHLHAIGFLALMVPTAIAFTRSTPAVAALQLAASLFVVGYAVVALRRVYGGRLASAIAKGLGLALVYWIVAFVALFATVVLTAVVG